MRMLVSVRSVPEALLAAGGGADFIDLKEPGEGALGGLPVATIAAIVRALRAHHIARPVSATIGDLPMHALQRIRAQVEAVGACGVDYVKVGIERGPQAFAVLDALAACDRPVVPVFVADRGLDAALVAHACGLPFPALMADTADKQAGSLFDAVPMAQLRHFLAHVRAAGQLVGLAGALRTADVPLLQALAPDFAGFRSAVCVGDRATALCPQRLAALAALLRGQAVEPLAA
ncbi:(5-formylfuran-3-yl)methyl phosphate synthase [Variovorax sp. WS11]|uniref:(5-formylfuran-3-yl)methyl phosphate synthase n=1 Tax=Variovorax sp. WS11 TaxID=1105204 RepID=UPI001EF1B425|nr:(5-formylfuran-3-yl)methyl phosphate synthase [Variovorax sp. WS11]